MKAAEGAEATIKDVSDELFDEGTEAFYLSWGGGIPATASCDRGSVYAFGDEVEVRQGRLVSVEGLAASE